MILLDYANSKIHFLLVYILEFINKNENQSQISFLVEPL